MSTAELVQRLVADEVAKWDSGPYGHTVTQLHGTSAAPFPGDSSDEGEEEGAVEHRCLVTWSRTSKTRPVPEDVVHATVFVKLMEAGPDLAVSFEREKTRFTSEEMGKVLLPLLERHEARKARVLDSSGINLVEPFNRDRLPAEYAEDVEDDADEEAAAVAIQAAIRGKMARKQVSERKEAAAADGHLTTASGAEVLSFDDDPDIEAAAVNIQRIARGKLSRAKVAERRSERGAAGTEDATAAAAAEGKEVEYSPEEAAAAVQMQRLSRGKLARKRVENIKAEEKSAVHMQRLARGRMARKRVDAMKGGDA